MIDSHPIVPDYIKNMRGVDKIDRSMADWSVSLKGNIFYRRIKYYGVNAALANMRIITTKIVDQAGNANDAWDKYTSKGSRGRFKWMLDMGHSLIERGILMDWPDFDKPRPKWMRGIFKPCTCNRCFHCKNKLTGPLGQSYKLAPTKNATAVTPSASARKAARPRSLSPHPQSTTKRWKGKTVSIEREHVRYPDKRKAVSKFPIRCGVCRDEKRSVKPVGFEGNEFHAFLHKTRLGCPHLKCRDHAVCDEHWAEFEHDWKKYKNLE